VKSLFIENVLDSATHNTLKTGWTRVGKSGLSNCMLTLLEWLGVDLGVHSAYIFFLLQKKALYTKC